MSRFLRLTALVLAVLAVGATPLAPSAAAKQPQATQDTSTFPVVAATFDVLMDQFYRPLEPRPLLSAAWDGARVASRRANAPIMPALAPLPEERQAALAAFKAQYQAYEGTLTGSFSPLALAFAAAGGMASSLNEAHTAFLPPERYRAFLASLSGADVPVGLGLQRSSRSPWVVTAIAPDGPADRAGLRVGDVIVAVDGRDASGWTATQLAEAYGGATGASHTIAVERGGARLDVLITRGAFYFPPVESRMLPGGVGYLRLSEFVQWGVTLPNNTELLSDLDRQLDALDAQGARGLVLDLRGNGGGDAFTAAEILGRFLPEDQTTVIRSDQRGHRSAGIVGGAMRRMQHPLVVLVDRGSASSSEVTASTLREAGRALLVGQRTAGALASAQILPLPEGAAIYVAVAEHVTARNQVKIDGAGFPVDIEIDAPRSTDDLIAGRDPAIDAAVAALAQAPAPPAYNATPAMLPAAVLRELLRPYMPDAAQIPTNDRLTRVIAAESIALTHPNQLMNLAALGARNPTATREAIRRRGWLDALEQGYSLDRLVPPSVSVAIDIYATLGGASQALAASDFPDVLQPVPVALRLGDETVAFRGQWLALGVLGMSWRRGNVVATVSYGDVAGFERTDVLEAVARLVDDALTRRPLTSLSELLAGAGTP